MTLDEYNAAVRAVLIAQNADSELIGLEVLHTAMGRRYGVGPADCAYQIIEDRADAFEASERKLKGLE